MAGPLSYHGYPRDKVAGRSKQQVLTVIAASLQLKPGSRVSSPNAVAIPPYNFRLLNGTFTRINQQIKGCSINESAGRRKPSQIQRESLSLLLPTSLQGDLLYNECRLFLSHWSSKKPFWK